MRVYLIDSENVTNYIKELNYLGKNDKVIIFVTVATPNISYSKVEYLLKAKCRIKILKCLCGYKDDLDKQIISYLGFELRCNSNSEYYIVSQDKGYSVVVDFWNSMERNVKLVGSIAESLGVNVVEKPSIFDGFVRICKQNSVDYLKVRSIILNSDNMSVLHNKLSQKYLSKGKVIYQALKDEYKNFEGIKKAIR